jgi:hypothetical protein
MKKINIVIFIGLFTCISLSSCNDDLNVVQTSGVPSNAMWKTQSDAESAMYGLFSQFRSAFSTGYMYWGEYRTGLWGEGLTSQAKRDQVYLNQIPTSHSQADWKNLYTTINDANLIIKHVPDITFNDEILKNKVLANAYFVRAFCYYWIGRIWGDAPILLDGFESTKQNNLYPSRSSADSVFAQINRDIQSAQSLIPSSVNDRSMASPAAIEMLKADYELWMYKVRNAGEIALNAADEAIQNVLGNSNYTLEPDYSNVFNDNLGQEIIFAWTYIQNEYTGGSPADWLVPIQYVSSQYIENPVEAGSNQQWCFFTDAYKSLLSEDSFDQRTKVSFDTFYDPIKKTTFQWINKYPGHWVSETRIFDSDIIVYRFADAILFDAEIKLAKHDVSGAVVALNKIAKRAYGKNDYYSSTLSELAVKDAILKERLKEFAAEGKLWWDYIRLGVVFQKVPSLTGRENEKNVLLWPVSQTTINENPKIKQTEGYDK